MSHTNQPDDCHLQLTPGVLQQLVTDQATQTVQLAHVIEAVGEIKAALKGNGKPGLLIRTDRLEQKEQRRARALWILFAGVATLTLRSVALFFGFGQSS